MPCNKRSLSERELRRQTMFWIFIFIVNRTKLTEKSTEVCQVCNLSNSQRQELLHDRQINCSWSSVQGCRILSDKNKHDLKSSFFLIHIQCTYILIHYKDLRYIAVQLR